MSGALAAAPEPVRRVAILTTGRQDWGILRSTCVALRDDPVMTVEVLAGGMHLSARHGSTIDIVRSDGFNPVALGASHEAAPEAHHQAAQLLALVGDRLAAEPPDALVLVGDRFETAAAALAATVATVPIAHLHGGEQTLGAFDDALRHAITKLAHLHLVSHEVHARRIEALGEDPSTIHVVGAPGLDAAFGDALLARAALEADLGLALEPPVVVVTVHPATLETDPVGPALAVARAMAEVPATYVVTAPNVDPGGDHVREVLERAAGAIGRRAVVVDSLGERRYWSLLRLADAMLGNSSSGVVEAPALGLPAVNVGDRQAGRPRWPGVVDVPAEPAAVGAALRAVLGPGFRAGLDPADRPVADGRAGRRIADIIRGWRPTRPPRKASIRIAP